MLDLSKLKMRREVTTKPKPAKLWEGLRRAFGQMPKGKTEQEAGFVPTEFFQEPLVSRDFYTRMTYTDAKQDSKELRKASGLGKGLKTYPAMIQDLWTIHFQDRFGIAEPKQDEFELNKFILDTIVDSEEYRRIHEVTTGDRTMSELAVLKMGEYALRIIMEQKEKQEKRDQENEYREEKGQDPLPEPSDFAMEAEVRGRLQKKMDGLGDELQATSQIMNDFAETPGEEGSGNEEGKGWGKGTGHAKTDYKEQMKLAKKVLGNRALLEVLDLAGRHLDAWTQQEYNRGEGIEEVLDVTKGDNLQRTLSSSMAEMTYNEWGWLAKLVDRQLDVTEMEGKEPKRKGNLVLMGDVSGSMSGNDLVQQGAMIFAALHKARKEGRGIGVIMFNGAVVYKHLFPNGHVTLDEAILIISIGASGGTSYWQPLKTAMDYIENSPHVEDGDIVMISDDCCRLNKKQIQTIVQRKEAARFELHYISIYAGNIDIKCPPKTALDDIADTLTWVSNATQEKAVTTLHNILRRKK